MLNTTALKNELISATNNKGTAQDALSSMGNAIASYLKANAIFNFSWVAVNGSGSPDPVTTAQGEFISLNISLSPSNADNQSDAIINLESELIIGVSAGMFNITSAGFVTTPVIIDSPPTINNLNIEIEGNNRENAMLQLATDIIDWIKQLIPTNTVSGTHGAYTGIGTVLNIQ